MTRAAGRRRRQRATVRARSEWAARMQERWVEHCPYWQSQNGGPKDLPGVYGPGTCMGGCYSEPGCMT